MSTIIDSPNIFNFKKLDNSTALKRSIPADDNKADEPSQKSSNTANDTFCWTDEEFGYQNFLKIKKKKIPTTSTEKNNFENSSDLSDESNIENNNPETSQSNMERRIKNIEDYVKIIKELFTAIQITQKTILRELVMLKHKNRNIAKTDEAKNIPIDIPCGTPTQFQDLEIKCNDNEAIEKQLATIFDLYQNHDMNKFLKANLENLLHDVATHFSWFGQQGNIPVKNFLILKLLIDSAQKNFQCVSRDEVVRFIKKWFQLVKDRKRKRLKSK